MLLAQQIQNIENTTSIGSGLSGKFVAGTKLSAVVAAILPFIFAAVGAALIFYIISGGISLMLSLGEPKAVAAARGRIMNGILGSLIVVFAYFIMQLLGNIFELPDFTNFFK
jgi:hypothetical protein